MKKLILIFASAALAAGGCSKENGPAEGGEGGTIRIACQADASIDASTGTDAAAQSATQSATRSQAAKPAVEDFTLRITGADFDRSWERVAAYNAEETSYYFVQGLYTVSVSYGDPEAEGLDKPYYAGSTQLDVLPRRTNTARITARIGNSQTRVRATEAFLKYYHDAEFTVTTASGYSHTFRPAAGVDEAPIWVKAGTSLTVSGTAKGQSQDGEKEGPTYTFNPEPLDATVAATCHIFTFDAKSAGSASLIITLGEGYTETRTLDVELNKEANADSSK